METCTTSADRIKSPALLTAAGFLLMLFPDSEVRTNRKTHLIYRLYSGEAPGVQEGGAQNKTNLPRSKGAVNPTGCAAAGCAMGCSAALPCSTKAAPERSKAVHSSYQHRAAPLTSLPSRLSSLRERLRNTQNIIQSTWSHWAPALQLWETHRLQQFKVECS